MKLLLFYFSCILGIAMAEHNMPGGSNSVSDPEEIKEIEKLFEDNKHLLADDDGNEHKWSLTASESIEKQVVSGILYKIHGFFKDENGNEFKGEVHIWTQPWLPNGTKVTLKNKTKLTKPYFLDKN